MSRLTVDPSGTHVLRDGGYLPLVVDTAWSEAYLETAAILRARAPHCLFTTHTVLRRLTRRGDHLVVAERRR